jgi:hypothetical protein
MSNLPNLSHLTYREKASRIADLREEGYSDVMIAKILGWKSHKTVQNQLHRSTRWDGFEEYRRQYRQRTRAVRKPSRHYQSQKFWDSVEDVVKLLWPKLTTAQIAQYLTETYGRTVTRNALIGKADRWDLPSKKKFKPRADNGRDFPTRYADARARSSASG